MNAPSKIVRLLTRINHTNLSLLIVYLLINLLFIWKYSVHYDIPSWLAALAFIVLSLFATLLVFHDFKILSSLYISNISYGIIIAAIAVVLTLFMLQFRPEQIASGRYPAINIWIERLFTLEYPYAAGIRPSGFPFLFVLGIPFYLIGDTGLLQIFGFLIFAATLILKYPSKIQNRLRVLLLLIISPVFLYEVAVRSELFTNMALVLLFIEFCTRREKESNPASTALLGFIGGLLLSTRGIVLLAYIPFWGLVRRKYRPHWLLFSLMILAGFLITLLPFIIWNSRHFISYGPFTIQMSYLPFWLLILSLVAALFLAWKARSSARAHISAAFILFGVVFIPFLISIFKSGVIYTILNDGFDISYFAFTIPFLLISLKFPDSTNDEN